MKSHIANPEASVEIFSLTYFHRTIEALRPATESFKPPSAVSLFLDIYLQIPRGGGAKYLCVHTAGSTL